MSCIIGIIGQTGFGKTYLANILARKHRRVIIADPFAQFKTGFRFDTIDETFEAIGGKNTFKARAVYENLDDYAALFRAVYHTGNVTLFVDELTLFAPSVSKTESSDILKDIAQRGRLKNINLVWTSQRPANIDRNISTQTDVIIAFRLTEMRDIDYLASEYRNKEFAIKMSKLWVGEYRIVKGDLEDAEIVFKNIPAPERISKTRVRKRI